MKNQSAVRLGSIRSDRKAQAARENGKLGGRPKVRPPAPPGFRIHPKWDSIAANAEGEIIRLRFNDNGPQWGPCNQRNHPRGYLQCYVPSVGDNVLCHRIVYECCHGIVCDWSTKSGDSLTIDHINRNKSDNCIDNLQAITNYQNMMRANGKHGLPRFVYKKRNRYVMRIQIRKPTRRMILSESYATVQELLLHRDEFLAKHGRAMPTTEQTK